MNGWMGGAGASELRCGSIARRVASRRVALRRRWRRVEEAHVNKHAARPAPTHVGCVSRCTLDVRRKLDA